MTPDSIPICRWKSTPGSFDVLNMFYLCGVEGAEREGFLRKEGGESGAPSSLSPRTAHLNAIGGPI